MEKGKSDLEKNVIDYLKKHQELDKFIYSFTSTFYFSLIAILCAVFMPLIIYQFTNSFYPDYIHLSITFILSLYLLILLSIDNLKGQNSSFRIREAMLRVWYNQINVDTDLLDSQFNRIKSAYKSRLSNKELENIAKKIIEE